MNDLYIMHYGVGHDKGGHSGRYPWGSGKNPKQDLGTFKKDIKKQYREAKKKTSKIMGKHPAWWRENYGSILREAGIHTVIGAAKVKNREKIKTAIENRLKTDPKFRATVKEAKKEWADVGREIAEEGKSFCEHYTKKVPNRQYAYAGKKLVNKYANYAKNYSNVSDAEFATYRMFDQQRAENKWRVAVAGAAIAYSTMIIAMELSK